MRIKRVLRPEALRRIPRQFSWIDQRLVSDHHLERCDTAALALYLFLVTVADAQGLSYYGDARLANCLSMPASRLVQARADLIRLDLIAYERAAVSGCRTRSAGRLRCEVGTHDMQRTLERIRAAFADHPLIETEKNG